ncbi:peptidoglycan-binding protein [Vreelandella profundi]|uniref:peptidoglycan-binding protein n=1 Tax=Vreelandella profundi TaxID=2852117 RepID=UPI001EF019F1|nr:peptidoglycan-binding protein [Halomonas profundi]
MAIKQHPSRRAFGALWLSAALLVSVDSAAENGQRVVTLSPQVRTLVPPETGAPISMSAASMDAASVDVARAFLRQHRVVDNAENINALAYVIAGEDRRLLSGAGDKLYVRGDVPRHAQVGIYRQSAPYHTLDGAPLGVELISIGIAQYVSDDGDIAQLEVLSSHREVRVNDLVLPLPEPALGAELTPRAPLTSVEGHIIAVPDGVRFIGRLQIVTLDVGRLDGLQPGHVLQVEQQGEQVGDPRSEEMIQLPSTEAGSVLVFKPFDHVSYALVMQASRVLEVGDQVSSSVR